MTSDDFPKDLVGEPVTIYPLGEGAFKAILLWQVRIRGYFAFRVIQKMDTQYLRYEEVDRIEEGWE